MPIYKLSAEQLLGENSTETSNSKVGMGVIGNYDTVKLMQKVARARSKHPLVRELALRILDEYGVDSQNYVDEAYAIGDFVKRKVRYVRDINGVETIHDPLTLIDQMRRNAAHGDCDDMSLLIAALLLSIGHQPYFRIVRYKPMPTFQHIYVVAYEQNYGSPKKRISLDAIMKRHHIGFEVKHHSGKEIKV